MISIYIYIYILEDDPRSTPGHLKVLDQIRSIMKFLIVANTVGLTKKLTKNFIFQHPLKSLKVALRVITKNANNVFLPSTSTWKANVKGENKKGTFGF